MQAGFFSKILQACTLHKNNLGEKFGNVPKYVPEE